MFSISLLYFAVAIKPKKQLKTSHFDTSVILGIRSSFFYLVRLTQCKYEPLLVSLTFKLAKINVLS